MFPYALDSKHSINDHLITTEHSKTLFIQCIFTDLKLSHYSVSWALVSEYYTIATSYMVCDLDFEIHKLMSSGVWLFLHNESSGVLK